MVKIGFSHRFNYKNEEFKLTCKMASVVVGVLNPSLITMNLVEKTNCNL